RFSRDWSSDVCSSDLGPIPTFAPPVVPVGPVVNGTGTMIPSGLVSPPSGAAALKKGKSKDVDKLKQQAKEMEEKSKNSAQEAKRSEERRVGKATRSRG